MHISDRENLVHFSELILHIFYFSAVRCEVTYSEHAYMCEY